MTAGRQKLCENRLKCQKPHSPPYNHYVPHNFCFTKIQSKSRLSQFRTPKKDDIATQKQYFVPHNLDKQWLSAVVWEGSVIHFSPLKTCHFGRVYFNRLMLVTLTLVFWIINDCNCIGSATLQISCIFGTLNEGEGQPWCTDWSPPVYVDAIRRERCREKDRRRVRGRRVLGDRQGLSRLACINPKFDSQS